MGKYVIRQMPNLLLKNKGVGIALVLFALSAGMFFFAGERLNQFVTTFFESMALGEVEAFFGILIVGIILSTAGYYAMKNIK